MKKLSKDYLYGEELYDNSIAKFDFEDKFYYDIIFC